MASPVIFEVPLNDSFYRLEKKPLFAVFELIKYVFFRRGAFSLPIMQNSVFVPTRLLNSQSEVTTEDPHSDLDPSRPENLPDFEIMFTPYNSSDLFVEVPQDTGLFTFITCPRAIEIVWISPPCFDQPPRAPRCRPWLFHQRRGL